MCNQLYKLRNINHDYILSSLSFNQQGHMTINLARAFTHSFIYIKAALGNALQRNSI